MPLYDYVCTKCGAIFEVKRGFFEKEREVACPTCGGKESRKLISSFSTASGCGASEGTPVRRSFG